MNPRSATDPVVLDQTVWQARRAAHEARVDAWTGPHLERRRRGEKHPVEDFLFDYYAQRPAALRRWHPGFGVALVGPSAREYVDLKGYVATSTPESDDVVTVSVEHVCAQRRLLETLHRLLTATAARPAQLGCFGMHEWAMVYRLAQDDVRHSAWPLRLGPEGTDAVVESHRIACSHFDAFRFFTGPARPRNILNPGRDDRDAFEQPGCLHAGMDLYKHAFRLTPMVPSELVADCFALARDIRVLDMRASPYDLSDLGYSPVAVETPEGKQEYVSAQRRFAERGAPLRARLVAECERLLAVGQESRSAGSR
ncbi:MAG TPA: 3-methyladenine DNA glycosylase [Nocardioides sp.]|nr:3-methyladenine DNA glycosylase [Nocardioides sp.]